MNNATFSADRVRQAVREYAERHSLHHLAKSSGVDWASLKRFISENKGLSIEGLEKIWPLVMEQPAPAPNQPQDAA
jgi:predicted transcriptional regulator